MTRESKLSLADGTLVRHKIRGYEGRIEGTTEIKGCFTRAGVLLANAPAKELFQYRVMVAGELMRQIAPAEDLEILEETTKIVCLRCNTAFQTKPGLLDKPAGRCECGGFICPSCWACQTPDGDAAKNSPSICQKQRKRFARKLAAEKKNNFLRK